MLSHSLLTKPSSAEPTGFKSQHQADQLNSLELNVNLATDRISRFILTSPSKQLGIGVHQLCIILSNI